MPPANKGRSPQCGHAAMAVIRSFFAALAVFATMAASADASIFLRIDGVPGESDDPDHPGWIELHSVHHGLSAQGLTGSPVQGHLLTNKRPDKASPKLAEAVASGRIFPEAVLEFTRMEGGQLRYFQVTLYDVSTARFWSELRVEGTSVELITFYFERMEWTYLETDGEGRSLANHKMHWDFVRNVGGGETEKLGFVVEAVQTAEEGLQLEWEAEEGRTYRLMRATDLGQAFEPVQDIFAETGGRRTFQLPATGSFEFYYLTELPE